MGALTTTQITQRVSVLLQDVAHVRWPIAEQLSYLTDGVRELCVLKPDACAKTATLSLVAGTRQTLPDDGVSLIDVIRNTVGDKRAPRRAYRELLDAYDPLWHASTPAQVVQHYTFDAQNQRVLHVYPPNTGTGALEIVYAAAPAELAEGDSLGVSDVWVPTLVNYVLYRCYSKDAEYAGNATLAAAYYTAFSNQLAGKTGAETAVDPNRNAV